MTDAPAIVIHDLLTPLVQDIYHCTTRPETLEKAAWEWAKDSEFYITSYQERDNHALVCMVNYEGPDQLPTVWVVNIRWAEPY